MSVGNGIRKIASEFNVGLRMCKFMGGFKPNNVGAVLGTSKCKDIPHISNQYGSHQISICTKEIMKLSLITPKLDVTIQKSIIEPEKSIKINFELPIRNSAVTALDLPLHIEKDIKEPGKVISKKAIYMIRVRRRKMRKHKKKKYLKKYAAELARRKFKREEEKEENFQAQLRAIFDEKEQFSAEKYVEDTLAKVHWEKPVTRVRGRLAPQWVIKQHLQETEEKRILQERIKECLK